MNRQTHHSHRPLGFYRWLLELVMASVLVVLSIAAISVILSFSFLQLLPITRLSEQQLLETLLDGNH